MGQVDMATRKYMADPERFADAFNYAIYSGRHVVDAGELSPLDSVSSAKTPKGKLVERRRDGLRLWTAMSDGRAAYALLGVEDQTKPNAAMPVRAMLYDAIRYADQVDELVRSNRSEGVLASDGWVSGLRESDVLLPVVTLVVHFGPEPWGRPTSLHAMLGQCDGELLSYVPDYRMNLVSPESMCEEDFRRFETELGLVLGTLSTRRTKCDWRSTCVARHASAASVPRAWNSSTRSQTRGSRCRAERRRWICVRL
ncbi:MAG: hypothetical protein Q4A07_02435 [Coriobacteriales bacterium]|nr:hypothetical protein [Coriobacteriales bacterium]